MTQFSSNLTTVVILLALLAFLGYTAIRVGPSFLIKRLAGLVFVLLGVTFITFLLVFLGAGPDGAGTVLSQCGQHCTPTVVRNLENFYHLRDPWYQQYAEYLDRLVHFDLGFSYISRERSVWAILQSGVPVSVQLQLVNFTLVLLSGIPLGISSALRAGSRFDTASSGASLLFFAIPPYLSIVFYDALTVFLATHHLPHLPASGWNGLFSVTIIAPAVTLALVNTAFFLRLTRTSMLEVLNQDYIRTARAKGLRDRVVVFKHGFRNAMIPLVTALGPALALSVSGAFFTETLFNIPGIGLITVQSIASRDYPVIQGTVLIAATAVVVMNLVVDVAYGILDPRIKVV
jgi:peptide/nickel transport system permease protein/oligopeptide transport system permease protein